MKKTLISLTAGLFLLAALTGCGMKETKTSNTAYRTQNGAYEPGRYYADDEGTVYGTRTADRNGMANSLRNVADDAADGVRNAGNAIGNTIDDMAR